MTSATVLSEQKIIKNSRKTAEKSYYRAKTNDLEIRALVQNAAKCIAPVWPIETFIACNPLQGFEGQSFEQALAQGYVGCKHNKSHPGLEAVNLQMIKWCGSFFDEGQSSIEMPYREQGLYYGFLKLACFDKQLHHHQKAVKQFLQQLPESPEEAIQICLAKLQVSQGGEQAFISQSLLYLPGWAGFVKWKIDWQNSNQVEGSSSTLIDFIAVRLVLTCILWPDAAKEDLAFDNNSAVQETLARIKKNEQAYQNHLLHALLPQTTKTALKESRKVAQLVFCIDVRSEPFRRALEALGHYETYGFAGFFGLPLRINDEDSDKSKACCPVLLKPRFAVNQSFMGDKKIRLRYQRGKKLMSQIKQLYSQLKHNFSTPFALVESLGFYYGLNMIFKSLAPHFAKKSQLFLKKGLMPKPLSKINYDLIEGNVEQGLSLPDQINYAETVLRLMGLTSDFAKFIIFCGHGSSTENNPYASALECGACGAHHGGINAQLLADILNNPEVREALNERGMHIPFDTVFYGALHNTTSDIVTLYKEQGPKPIYPQLLQQLEEDLIKAGIDTNKERSIKLNTAYSAKEIVRRTLDWSETRPEWGLAQNAAFIVAPRHMTKDISLDGRCFLHSYRFDKDEEGDLLATILTAPMVVAEWINTQYLFSTIDNVAFGSGSKITHNVVGKIGVMQGNASDLMHGLPLQSVMSHDEQAYHVPQRLLTLVYAPRELLSKVIEKHSILKTLFLNQWVHLLAIDPISQLAYRFDKTGEWVSV